MAMIDDFRQTMKLCVRIESNESIALIDDSSSTFAELLSEMVKAGLTVNDFMELQRQVREAKNNGYCN